MVDSDAFRAGPAPETPSSARDSEVHPDRRAPDDGNAVVVGSAQAGDDCATLLSDHALDIRRAPDDRQQRTS
ncbi:MAG: hypothetical protein ACTJGR_03200 [Pauljensenia sp.]